MKDGVLSRVDGRYELRFVRPLAHPVDKVWRAVTSPEGLAAWFPFDIEGERRDRRRRCASCSARTRARTSRARWSSSRRRRRWSSLGGRRDPAARARADGRRLRSDADQPLRRDRQGRARRRGLARLSGRAGGVAGRRRRCRRTRWARCTRATSSASARRPRRSGRRAERRDRRRRVLHDHSVVNSTLDARSSSACWRGPRSRRAAVAGVLALLGLLVAADRVLERLEADDPDARAERAVAAVLLDVAAPGAAAAAVVAAASAATAAAAVRRRRRRRRRPGRRVRRRPGRRARGHRGRRAGRRPGGGSRSP